MAEDNGRQKELFGEGSLGRLCPHCRDGLITAPKRKACDGCREKKRAHRKRQTREWMTREIQRRRGVGLCIVCGKEPVASSVSVSSCRKCLARSSDRSREGVVMRREAVAAYGGRCACCGEDLAEALHIDHVRGNGAEERSSGLRQNSFYKRLKEQGWPPDYQVLCATCNFAKKRSAECPHAARDRDLLSRLAAVGLTY